MNCYLLKKQVVKSCLCALVVALSACGGKPNGNQTLLNGIKSIDKRYDDNSKLVYLVMPNQGCAGCISEGETFVRQHYNMNDKVRFIFTKTNSLKLLKNKLGNAIFSNKNVLKDTSLTIVYPEVSKNIYPMTVYVNRGEIEKIDYESPGETGLPVIEKYIQN